MKCPFLLLRVSGPVLCLLTRWWLCRIVLYHDFYHDCCFSKHKQCYPHGLTCMAQKGHNILELAYGQNGCKHENMKIHYISFLSDPITHGTNHPFLLIGLPVLAITVIKVVHHKHIYYQHRINYQSIIYRRSNMAATILVPIAWG